MYDIIITMRAEVPEVIDLDDVAREAGDTPDILERLIEEMEGVDPEEAADQIHEQYRFLICPECRSRMHRGLKRRWLSLHDCAPAPNPPNGEADIDHLAGDALDDIEEE